MNSDIRLHCTFKGHRKRLRLGSWLGDKATDYLIDLWLTVAEERPLGILTGWDERDIALAAGYPNDPAKFIEALTDSKLLERNSDGIYRLHDWEDHQPWAIGATERSNLGRIAAMKRWHPNSDGMPTACQPHTDGNAPYPSPSPIPNNVPPISPKGFDVFWKAYPKKVAKKEAIKAFSKLKVDDGLLAKMTQSLEVAKASTDWQREGGKFIPNPATWLNGERWEDEIANEPKGMDEGSWRVI